MRGWLWEASFGNGFLERLEHRQQYKLNGLRRVTFKRHKVTLFSIGYYGFSDLSGLIPINVLVPGAARMRAELVLKTSEEKFAKAFRQGPLGLAITSTKDHRYIDINETFERVSGWRRDEVIGRTPFDIGLWGGSGR